jgi:hypothetical protein
MTPSEKLHTAEAILVRIDQNTRKAIALAALFGRAANHEEDFAPHFDNSPAADGYNHVLDALYFELVLTVARLFDEEKRDADKPMTASIPVLILLLDGPDVFDALRQGLRKRHDPSKIKGMDDLKKDRYRQSLHTRIDDTISKLPQLLKRCRDLKGHTLVRTIRGARNAFMAHTALTPSRDNLLAYGQAESLLWLAVPLITQLQASVRSYYPDYTEEGGRQSELAGDFWRRASCQ